MCSWCSWQHSLIKVSVSRDASSAPFSSSSQTFQRAQPLNAYANPSGNYAKMAGHYDPYSVVNSQRNALYDPYAPPKKPLAHLSSSVAASKLPGQSYSRRLQNSNSDSFRSQVSSSNLLLFSKWTHKSRQSWSVQVRYPILRGCKSDVSCQSESASSTDRRSQSLIFALSAEALEKLRLGKSVVCDLAWRHN